MSIEWADGTRPHPSDHPELARTTDFAVLPESIEGSRGIYRAELDSLVKHLRMDGIDASYIHDADQRSWRVLQGEAELAFAVAVAAELLGNASWDAIKLSFGNWLSLIADKVAHMRVTIRIDRDETRESLWMDLEGRSEDVIAALDRVSALFEKGNSGAE